MKVAAFASATLLLWTSAAHADPPPAPSPSALRCTVTSAGTTFVAAFNYASMTGTVTIDGALGTRRFTIKATPYAATYNLIYQGYAALDQKPAAEAMTKGKSIVARLVSIGDTTHLFFDSDLHLNLKQPMAGFVCQ